MSSETNGSYRPRNPATVVRALSGRRGDMPNEDNVIVNLTFHGIGEPTRYVSEQEAEVWLTELQFHAILDSASGRTDVRFTFDDANHSDIAIALPALMKRDLTATFFMPVARLDAPGFLRREEVATLAEAGMEIGSHGMRHRPWRGLPDDELEEELGGAKRLLEEVVRRPVTQAACPFGAYDRRVLRRLRASGFERVFTSDRGTAVASAWLQTRNTLQRDDGPGFVDLALAVDGAGTRAFARQAKLAIKRWR